MTSADPGRPSRSAGHDSRATRVRRAGEFGALESDLALLRRARAAAAAIRGRARPVSVLPHPDSPTSATTSPAETVKLTPSTATVVPPSSRGKEMSRSVTSSRAVISRRVGAGGAGRLQAMWRRRWQRPRPARVPAPSRVRRPGRCVTRAAFRPSWPPGGGAPSPRKESPASSSIASATPSVAATSTGGKRAGKNLAPQDASLRRAECPRGRRRTARAAAAASRRGRAGPSPASRSPEHDGKEPPGDRPIAESNTSSTTMRGTASPRSISRRRSAAQQPLLAAGDQARSPCPAAAATTDRHQPPTPSEMRAPRARRAKTSRENCRCRAGARPRGPAASR